MNLKPVKTYIIKFKNKENYIQFSLELNNKLYNSITLNSYIFKENYIYILKIPIKRENLIPHFKEYGFIKQISKLEAAYYKEYGKPIKP